MSKTVTCNRCASTLHTDATNVRDALAAARVMGWKTAGKAVLCPDCAPKKKRSKYNNQKTKIDGEEFDSLAEGDRARRLMAYQRDGDISNLTFHPKFEIIPAFTDNAGKYHRATIYEADSSYYDVRRERWIVEDFKGIQTQAFVIKMKLFLLKYPQFEFRLVGKKRKGGKAVKDGTRRLER